MDLILILQEIQEKYGYIPEGEIREISRRYDIPPVKIYEVITFYTQFKTEKPGRHIIKVCQGTACHVMGGHDLLNWLKGKLEIEEGQKTKDERFSLERVACLGCCGMAPVVLIDKDFYGRCTIQKLEEILKKYE